MGLGHRASIDTRHRPVASGRLSIPLALMAIGGLGAAGFSLAALINLPFVLALGVFTAISVGLPRRRPQAPRLQLICGALFLGVRVAAGAMAIGTNY